MDNVQVTYTGDAPAITPTLGEVGWLPGQSRLLDAAIAASMPADLFSVAPAPAEPAPSAPSAAPDASQQA